MTQIIQYFSPINDIPYFQDTVCNLPVREWFSARVCGRVTGAHKLNPLKLHPRLIGCPVEPSIFKDLSQERYYSLCPIFVHAGKIYLITEEDQPFVELYRCQHYAIRCSSIFTVMVKCLQEEFWGCSTGEVQTYHLWKTKMFFDGYAIDLKYCTQSLL